MNPKTKSKFVWKVKSDTGFRDYEMTYTKWETRSAEPNWGFGNGGESCINLWPQYGYTWNDEPCDKKYCFVCES